MLTADAARRGCAVDLLGLPMHVEAREPICAAALASTLGGARVITEVVPLGRLLVTVAAPPVPMSPPGSSTPEFETWRPCAGEIVVRHRSGLTARATSTTIDIGGEAEHYAANFRRVCTCALAHLLAQHDRFVVHGAAIVSDARGILVLGNTGAGKSTLALCALLASWDVLTDDLAVLWRSGSVPMIGGVPRPLAVPSDVFAAEMFDSRPIVDDPRARHELPPGVIALGSFPLAGSIVLRHGDEPRGRVEPVRAHALLHDVLGSWALLEGPEDFRRILPLAASVARGNATALSFGNDPETRVADTMVLLDDVRAQLGLT